MPCMGIGPEVNLPAEMPHDWDAHWRPVGAEIYITSCDLGIFRGSAHRADLAPGCRLCCQFPDGQGGLADSGISTVRMGGGFGSISLLSLAGGPVSACVSMKLLDQEPCRVCDVVAFPVAADLVIAVGVVAAGFPVAEPEVERRGPVVVVVDAGSDLLVTASAGQGLGCVHDRGPDAGDRSSGLTAKALNSG